jgi:hypothetical protein
VKLRYFALWLNLCDLPLHDVFPHLIAKGEVADDKSCKKCSRLGSWVNYSKASLHHKEGGDLPFDLGLSASVLATPHEIAYQAFEMCTHGHRWALAWSTRPLLGTLDLILGFVQRMRACGSTN